MAFSKFHFFLIPVFSSVVLSCIDLKPSPCPAPSSHPCGFALLGPLFLNSTWLTSMWLNTCLCTPRIGPTPVLCFSSRHLTYHREPQWVSFPQGWVCLALYLIRHVLHAFFFLFFCCLLTCSFIFPKLELVESAQSVANFNLRQDRRELKIFSSFCLQRCPWCPPCEGVSPSKK